MSTCCSVYSYQQTQNKLSRPHPDWFRGPSTACFFSDSCSLSVIGFYFSLFEISFILFCMRDWPQWPDYLSALLHVKYLHIATHIRKLPLKTSCKRKACCLIPVSSFWWSRTLDGAVMIGTLPKYPLLRPRANETITDHVSLDSIGRLRGAAQNIISGTRSSLATEHATSRPRGQSYWTDAII